MTDKQIRQRNLLMFQELNLPMPFGIFKQKWYCRWCQFEYKPKKSLDKDGFCSNACKMAHYRAYHKYLGEI